jgi:hypothetical protein
MTIGQAPHQRSCAPTSIAIPRFSNSAIREFDAKPNNRIRAYLVPTSFLQHSILKWPRPSTASSTREAANQSSGRPRPSHPRSCPKKAQAPTVKAVGRTPRARPLSRIGQATKQRLERITFNDLLTQGHHMHLVRAIRLSTPASVIKGFGHRIVGR